jgi:hypothetical protein
MIHVARQIERRFGSRAVWALLVVAALGVVAGVVLLVR